MLRATFDKAAWLKDHGVSEEWPTSGLPEMIGVDNGSDFKSATFRRACENEGIRVEFRPPGRPHYGGHIERLMGTMMKDVHALPGTTFSSVAERGRQDPAKSAGLTLHELETYFAIEIVDDEDANTLFLAAAKLGASKVLRSAALCDGHRHRRD